MNLQFSFNTANEEFMKVGLADTSLNQRTRNALMRVGFRTVGDVVRAVSSDNDLLGKGGNGVKKIRNLGEKSARSVIPILYSTYISMLDEKKRALAMATFINENTEVIKKHPEFAVVTLDYDIFQKFLQGWD